MDYLLKFDSEQAAQAALPTFYRAPYSTPDDDFYQPGGWDTSVCIPNVQVWKVTGTVERIDDAGNAYLQDVREVQLGWFIRMSVETGLEPFDATGLVAQPVFAQ